MCLGQARGITVWDVVGEEESGGHTGEEDLSPAEQESWRGQRSWKRTRVGRIWPLIHCGGQGRGRSRDDADVGPRPPRAWRQMLWEAFPHQEKAASATIRTHSQTRIL